MTAAEIGIFLEQALLDIEAEILGFLVGETVLGIGQREFVDHAVGEQDVVERLVLVFGFLGDQIRRPDFLDLKALGEFHELPEVGFGLARRIDLLTPELGPAFGIAIGALLLHPHGGGQDQVGGHRGHRRIGIGDNDEILRVAITGPGLLVHVGRSLHVVVAHYPVNVEVAVLQLAVLQHRMEARLARNGPFRQLPFFLGDFPVRLLHHHQVGGQAMGEGAHLARRAAGRGLAGQRERAVAGLGNLTGQQMNVVAELIHPGAAGMLVEAHGPQ